MSIDSVNNRFNPVVQVLNASSTQRSNQTTTAALVYGSDYVLHPGEAQDGLTFRWTIAGTKTATNAAHTVTLVIDGSTVFTLTADDATAVDWVATIILRCSGGAVQKIAGFMSSNTTDCEADYAAGTSALSAGATIGAYITAGNSSDTVTSEFCILEAWLK